MAEALKTKHVTAPAIKTADLPDDVAKAGEGEGIDRWYYASVEASDRENDVVRIAGIDTAKYTQHGGPIKVLVNHQRSPDGQGRLPIAGKVVKWVATKHKGTGKPAMAAGLKFVDTELGREIKTLADEDLLDVSIGFEAVEHAPNKSGGIDYTKSAIAEISVCVTGMNQFCGILRALDGEKPAPAPEAKPAVVDLDPIKKYLDIKTDEQTNSLLAVLQTVVKRLDDLEDSLSELPKAAAPQSDRNEQQSQRIDLGRLAALLAAS